MIISIVLLSVVNAFAGQIIWLDREIQIDKNPFPLVKSFKVRTENFKAIFNPDEESFGTRTYADIHYRDLASIDKYAIVQFIRGCQFYSKLNERGDVEKSLGVSREFFGEIVKFKHSQWVIDSIDLDPIYNSSSKGRMALYRWNEGRGYDPDKEHYLGEGEPRYPRLYVRDIPGTAFYSNGSAKNISLEMKTCIVEKDLIPLITLPNSRLSGVGKCFKWQSSHIYNFKKKSFERHGKVDPFCTENF